MVCHVFVISLSSTARIPVTVRSELVAGVMKSERERPEPSLSVSFILLISGEKRSEMTVSEGIRQLVGKDVIDRINLR